MLCMHVYISVCICAICAICIRMCVCRYVGVHVYSMCVHVDVCMSTCRCVDA